MHMRDDPEVEALLERLGITKEEREITRDLSRNAAEKALESIKTVARTAFDQRMSNVIMLSACLMVGEAAEKTIVMRMEQAVDRMPPDVRAKFDELFKEPEPQQKRQGVRDFDGNYQ